MTFGEIFQAVKDNPTAAMLVLAILAIGWLVRDQRRRDLKNAARLEELHAAHTKALQESFTAHLNTAMSVVGTATKLITCVEILERITTAQQNARGS